MHVDADKEISYSVCRCTIWYVPDRGKVHDNTQTLAALPHVQLQDYFQTNRSAQLSKHWLVARQHLHEEPAIRCAPLCHLALLRVCRRARVRLRTALHHQPVAAAGAAEVEKSNVASLAILALF